MAKRPCLDCGRLTTGSRCIDCRRAKDRRRGAGRPTPSQRGYGSAWRALREQILDRDGRQCTRCGTAGEQGNPLTVDHITAKSHGGSDDPSNLRTLCKRCHGRKGV